MLTVFELFYAVILTLQVFLIGTVVGILFCTCKFISNLFLWYYYTNQTYAKCKVLFDLKGAYTFEDEHDMYSGK